MDLSLTDTVIQHQKKAEWLFAAAVYMNDASARMECGWLDPRKLKDLIVRDFWQRVTDGQESTKAAIDCGIFYKLNDYMSANTFSASYLHTFAETIADDVYLIEMAEALKQVAGFINERQAGELQRFINELGRCSPGCQTSGYSAADASLEFMGGLDDDPGVIKTGLPKMDHTFGGWAKGTLNLLAARPSMGKTSLALQFATACCDAGGKALYFSIEMKRKALWSRLVCGTAEMDHRLYKTRTWTDEQRAACITANNYLVGRYAETLVIDDRSRVTNADIWKAVAQYKPDLLIVDHLGLVAEECENNVLRVGRIAWAGKQIAKEFNCASLYLCQLNRGDETGTVKMPTLNRLRDSGELEQDADTVIFIHRPDYYENSGRTLKVSETDLRIAKDREGVRDVNYKLMYHLVKQRFFETINEANNPKGMEYVSN